MPIQDFETAVRIDQKHLLHPLHHHSEHQNPKIWVRGEGSFLYDMQGEKYIDGLSGLWNVNIGHGRKELAQVAASQMETLAYCSSYTGTSNLPAIELAQKLASLAPKSINTFFFTSGGGESTDSSIKTARFYWKVKGKPSKTNVISRLYGYHGVTLAAMCATGLSAYWPMFEPRIPGFSHIASPYPLYFNHAFTPSDKAQTPGQGAAQLLEEEILRQGADKVAAFIAEPVQGAGGVILPQEDYFKHVRAICDKYEVLLIADEVITGFGRTGTWFGMENYGVEPDIVNFAKGITSGYAPLGGIGVNDSIRQAIDDVDISQRWMHAYTYSGHPTCCSVALANLKIVEEEDLVARAAENGAYFQRGLKTLEKNHQHVGEARGIGLMGALELLEDGDVSKPFDPALKMGAKVGKGCVARGLWSRVKDDVYLLAPPLSTPRDTLDDILTILDESLSEAEL